MRVPKTDLLGELNKGFYHLIKFLNPERIICAAATVGLAQGAFEEALEYAKTRIAFGKPIGQFQTLHHWLADMAVEIEMGRIMTYKAAWLLSDWGAVSLRGGGGQRLGIGDRSQDDYQCDGDLWGCRCNDGV